MEPITLLRMGGSAWEIARTFLLLTVSSSAAGSMGTLSAPLLAAVGAAGLVMPAAFVMYALAPDRHGAFLPLLRLGKGLEAASLLLLLTSGALPGGGVLPYFATRMVDMPAALIGFAFLLDLLVLYGLLRVRGRP